MKLDVFDYQTVIKRYTERYANYGHSPKTLGWDKGKQPLRFNILSTIIEPNKDFSILDIGCGFGDLFGYLRHNYSQCRIFYHGIDIVPALINEGKLTYRDEGGGNS